MAELEAEIDLIDSIRDDAQSGTRPNLAAAATAASRWASLREKRHRVVVELALLDDPDPLHALQVYRDAAFIEGGGGGLSDMLRMEIEITEKREAEDAAARRATTGGKLDALIDAIRRLPPQARLQVRAALAEESPTAN